MNRMQQSNVLEDLIVSMRRRHRRCMIVVLLLYLLLAAFCGYSLYRLRLDSSQIRSRRFVLVDEQDRPLAVLGVEDGVTGLEIYGSKGLERVKLSAGEAGLQLAFRDQEDNLRAVLEAREDDAFLALRDKLGQRRVTLMSIPAGSGLTLWDNLGQTRVGLSTIQERAGLVLLDGENNIRAGLDITEQDGPQLRMRDENGRIVWSAP